MLTLGGVVSTLPSAVDAAELLPATSLTTAETRNGPSEESLTDICAVAVPPVSVRELPKPQLELSFDDVLRNGVLI